MSSSSEEEEEDSKGRRLICQTTREATPAERRPLDSSSSSSSSSDEAEAESEDDDDNAPEDSQPQKPPPISPLRRSHASTGNLHTAHLPLSEQRRLTESQANDADTQKAGSPDVEDLAPERDLDVEDYWRLGELRAAAAQRASLVARGRGSSGSLAGQMGIKGSTGRRKKEEERGILGSGMAERVSPEGDDGEDEGVEMGGRFLKRSSGLGRQGK